MQYHRIPHSSLEVSTLGLGTMTFGEQNSEADAHAQLDYAVAQGINLIDVAEMYPVPPRPETQGLTETYVGNWLAKHGSREKLIIASKVSGPSRNNDKGIRPDQALDRKNIREALHDSLKRLQTDYLDLYQYSAAIFLIPICISFDTAEKRRYATYLILNRRFSFAF